MVEPKPKVTLIGAELAQQGLEFVYEGEIEECAPCSLKKTCNNLKRGKKYRIVGIRPTRHPCQVHLNGTRAVEVMESPIPALINADMAIKNTRIQYEFSCTRTTCSNYALCHPEGIVEGDRYVVIEVLGQAAEACEKGRALQMVELRSA